ncbi:MAG: tetratricopeptide repeat protein, partial [Saprospiraceae bacterium]
MKFFAKTILVFVFGPCSFLAAQTVVDTAVVKKAVDSLVLDSRSATNQRNFDEGFRLGTEAEKLVAKMLGEKCMYYSNTQFNLGRVHHIKGDFQRAKEYYLKCKNLRFELVGSEHPQYIRGLANLAVVCHDLGEYAEAEPLYYESLRFWEKTATKTSPDYLLTANNLAVFYASTGEHRKAKNWFAEIRDIRKEVLGEHHPDYALSVMNLAIASNDAGEFDKVEPLYKEALAIREDTFGRVSFEYAQCLSNFAIFYSDLGENEKAERLFMEVKSTYGRVLGLEHPEYANILVNLAVLYNSLGLSRKALMFLTEAERIFAKNLGAEHPSRIRCLNNFGVFYRDIGNLDSSLFYHSAANGLWLKTVGKHHLEFAKSISNLGSTYKDLGKLDTALAVCSEAEQIWKDLFGGNHPNYAASLNNLATIYYDLGNYEKAAAMFEQAKRVREKTLGKVHADYLQSVDNLAGNFRAWGKSRLAASYFIEAAQVTRSLFEAERLFLSEYELEQSLRRFQVYQNKLFSFGLQHRENQKAELCGTLWNNLLLQKEFLLENSKTLENLVRNAPDSIQAQHLNWKGRRIRLALEYAKPISEQKNTAQIEEEINSLEKILVRAVPGFGNALKQVTWQDVQQNLKPEEAAIEFVSFTYHNPFRITDTIFYAALVLRPGDRVPVFVPLFEEKQLSEHLSNASFLRDMEERVAFTYLGITETELYRLIWKPLEPLLLDAKTVFYAPSGLLHRVSFSLISKVSGKPLLPNYDLRLVGSTREIALGGSKLPGSELQTALLFGGIDYTADSFCLKRAAIAVQDPSTQATDGEPSLSQKKRGGCDPGMIPDLSGTKIETDKLAVMLQSRAVVRLLQSRSAREEEIKLLGKTTPSPDVLHIATHGFFCDNPEVLGENKSPSMALSLFRSGLLLAGADCARLSGINPKGMDDGILYAYEVADLNLAGTKLVVLSACETALGDIRGGEGVYGLARAFRLAGAEHVMMSLWQINDEQTVQFMEVFYEKWTSKQDIREAFCQTQRTLKEAGVGAEVWGAFVLL